MYFSWYCALRHSYIGIADMARKKLNNHKNVTLLCLFGAFPTEQHPSWTCSRLGFSCNTDESWYLYWVYSVVHCKNFCILSLTFALMTLMRESTELRSYTRDDSMLCKKTKYRSHIGRPIVCWRAGENMVYEWLWVHVLSRLGSLGYWGQLKVILDNAFWKCYQ